MLTAAPRCCLPMPRRLPPQLPFRPSLIWNKATYGSTSDVSLTTRSSSLKIFAKCSLLAMRIVSTTAPAIMLTQAATFAALLAAVAALDPSRLPTRELVATPMPKGIVFMIWSAVIITLCDARGIVPSRPAARATISNAHHSVPTWMIPSRDRRAKVVMFLRQSRDQGRQHSRARLREA